MSFKKLMCFILLMCFYIIQSKAQTGPDPWNFESKLPDTGRDDIPPDLRIPVQRKQAENKPCSGEWFFKRTLAIVLKGGATKVKGYLVNWHYQYLWKSLALLLSGSRALGGVSSYACFYLPF